MNVSIEKVQFENDDDSLFFLTQQKIDARNKKLKILKVCGDVMYLVYSLPLVSSSTYIIQKISLNEPDVVITLKFQSGKTPSVKDFIFNKIKKIFKLYNESVPAKSHLLMKTVIKQETGQRYEYFLLKNENHDTVIPLPQLNKRHLDISTTSNYFGNSILLGTKNGKIYHYDFSNDSIIKLNQYSAPVQGLHYNKKDGILTVVVGVTIMKYFNVDNILKFGIEFIPNEIENYGNESTDADIPSEIDDLNKVSFVDNLYSKSYVVNYNNELVVNNYDRKIKNGNVLLKNIFFNSNNVVDCCLSQYHLICITDDNKMNIINQLNIEKMLINQLEDVQGKLLGLDVDYIKQNDNKISSTYWLYDNSNNVFEIILSDEYEDVIEDLINLNRYKEVLNFDLKDYDKVQDIYNRYFNYLINNENTNFNELVTIGGKIHNNFTTIITTLMNKLQSQESPNDFIIIKLVTLLKERVSNFHTNLTENQIKIYLSLILQLLTQLDSSLVNTKMVREFLVQNHTLLDVSLTKNLLSESPTNLVFYLKLIKDYKSLINYHLTKNDNFLEAIKIISVYCNDPKIVYETADILLMNCPEETVKTWVKLIINQLLTLDIELLLSSLLKYFYNIYQVENLPDKKNHALWFLSWYHSTYDSNNKVINNYIVHMLFLDNKHYDLDRVLSFINDNWDNLDQFLLLNLAQKNNNANKVDVTVYILNKLQMYEESLKICLQEGLFDTARDVINSIDVDIYDNNNTNGNTNNLNLKKKLWILIAKHTITNSYNSKMNLKPIISDLINESDGLLTLIDVFPIINKLSVTVAVIKDEFISNLNQENKILTETNKEIENLISLKQKILKDIDYLTLNYHQEIHDTDICDHCHDNLILKKKFYCFPCCHKLHVNCILEMILKGGDFALKNNVEMIIFKKGNNWLSDLNILLAKKCPICTDININNIDEPFVLDLSDEKNIINKPLNGGVSNSSIDYLKL